MSEIAIKVESLGKSYLVGHNSTQERYTALRDVITHNVTNLVRKTRDMMAGRPIVQGDDIEEFWALRDVNFEIKQGDRVGIIGRNGAGKSTLLKILSRITEPSHGRVSINGRVSSLLEVGTGFHPELSGRENIFLNGAILGMSRQEIQRKFDEIVDFSEVERFLDTPVKRYSSGMYVRLAFAVAAHLEPEILIVDEVLAVGDAQFQKKCLGKMDDVSRNGRTVLFVSHNMDAINSLCNSAILMDKGNCILQGSTSDVTRLYLGNNRESSSPLTWKKPSNLKGKFDHIVDILGYQVTSETGDTSPVLFKSSKYSVEVEATIKSKNENIVFFLSYYNTEGDLIFVSDCYDNPVNYDSLEPGRIVLKSPLPSDLLNNDTYFIELSCVIHHMGWVLPGGQGQRMEFKFVDDTPPNKMKYSANHPFTGSTKPGILSIKLPWQIKIESGLAA